MEKEFVPYEEALALKELGFDESCFGAYGKSEEHALQLAPRSFDIFDHIEKDLFIKAPLYQQAFRWFRENYNLSGEIHSHQFYYSYYIIFDTLGANKCSAYKLKFESYEEAELECLRKLIELVKNKA